MIKTIAVSGANGFIGQNLLVQLEEHGHKTIKLNRDTDGEDWLGALRDANFVIHCAGVNRPDNEEEFFTGNVTVTKKLCDVLSLSNRPIPIIYTSSSQAENDSSYGRSKREAEAVIEDYAERSGANYGIYRLPNVFGKWCKPNYNSAVATFCHNLIHDLPIKIHDSAAPLNLVYIDDLVEAFIATIESSSLESGFQEIEPIYETNVGVVAEILKGFRNSRDNLKPGKVGEGLNRALYATYLSYLHPSNFAYKLRVHEDPRGLFSEMLRTDDSGQFSYFTAHPGATRGGHYHHTKNEKFLVVKGKAQFGFRHILTNETFERFTEGSNPEIVETVPGWAHDITNIGDETMIVLLWANECFDPDKPDTIRKDV